MQGFQWFNALLKFTFQKEIGKENTIKKKREKVCKERKKERKKGRKK